MPILSEGLATDTARQIWSAALGQLQLEIPRPNYETWLKPTSTVGLVDDILTISTPSPFAAEMLEKRLSGTIVRTVSRVAGRKLEVQFKVHGSNGAKRSENLLIEGADNHVKTKERWIILKEFFYQNNIDYKEIVSVKGSILSKIINLIYLLDYSTIYKAVLNGSDPSLVKSIEFIKSKL